MNKIPLHVINLDSDGFHLLVEIVVFGAIHYAVLDTGASRSVFDKAFVAAHLSETSVINPMQANTLFSTTETAEAILPTLGIGSLTLKNYTAMAIELSSVTETYAQFGHPPIVAIIGGDILMKHKGRIDYGKRILRLNKRSVKVS